MRNGVRCSRRQSGRQLGIFMELWLVAIVTVAGTEGALRFVFSGGPIGIARVGVHVAALVAVVVVLRAWAILADRRFRREVERSRSEQEKRS